MKSVTLKIAALPTGEHVEEVVELTPDQMASALIDVGQQILAAAPSPTVWPTTFQTGNVLVTTLLME